VGEKARREPPPGREIHDVAVDRRGWVSTVFGS
jgi:hypothetical protein